MMLLILIPSVFEVVFSLTKRGGNFLMVFKLDFSVILPELPKKFCVIIFVSFSLEEINYIKNSEQFVKNLLQVIY